MALAQKQNPRTPDELDTALVQVAARVRGQHVLRLAVRGLAIGLGIDIGLAFLARMGVLPLSAALGAGLLLIAGAGAGIGAALGSGRRIAPMDAARLTEMRLPLKERLSSALEFGASAHPNPLQTLQHTDAVAHARTVQPGMVAPLRLTRETLLLPILLLLLALTLWLPGLPFAETPAHRAEREAVQRTGTTLARAARAIERAADARHDAAGKAAAQKLQKAGTRMAQGKMDKTQALAALSRAEQEMATQQQSGASHSDPGQAARALAQASQKSSATNKSNTGNAAKAAPARSGTKPSGAANHPSGQKAGGTASGEKKGTQASPHADGQPQNGQKAGTGTAAPGAGGPQKQPADASHPNGTSPSAAQSANDMHRAIDQARREIAPGASPSPESGQSPGQSSRAAQSPGGSDGHTGEASGKTNGAPGSGGGGAKEVKFPFHTALPPTVASQNKSLSLGSPAMPGSKTVPLPRQAGMPNAAPGASRVPYGTALPAARRGAEAAMDTQNIPPSERAAVRDYFNSLQNAK